MVSFNPQILSAIPLLPLAAAVLVGILGTNFGKVVFGRVAIGLITIFGVAASFVLSLYVLFSINDGESFDCVLYTWAAFGNLKINFGFLIDGLTAVMISVVTAISLAVHVYAVAYMEEEESVGRFFSYISLFTFSMLVLVMSNNFAQLFFGWEAVGLTSYLLIGFWFDRPQATSAAMKAFIVNRIGDFAFILGVGILFCYADSLQYKDVFAKGQALADAVLKGTSWRVIDVACVLLFIGAMAKSAQFPLHIWLPDSMEGPTPVSALIHSATMVTAGIFLVSRASPLFEFSEFALCMMLVAGGLTALFMGLSAMMQNDIKRIIAYSTLSQLGYMVAALGASAYAGAIFHLVTHAFYKALLFLCAGSVILGVHHDQDVRNMGGLRKYMPKTCVITFIAILSLIGMPFFSGFYSKESIISAVYHSSLWAAKPAYYVLLIGVFLTAFYSLRLFFVVFFGEENFADKHRIENGVEMGLSGDEKPHEAGRIMLAPMIALAIPSVIIGIFAVSPMLSGGIFDGSMYVASFHRAIFAVKEHVAADGAFMLGLKGIFSLPNLIMLIGSAVAWYFYIKDRGLSVAFRGKISSFYKILENDFYLNWLSDKIFVELPNMVGRFLWTIGDQLLIDKIIILGSARVARFIGGALWGSDRILVDKLIVDGSIRIVSWFAGLIRRWQSGSVYHYALVMIFGLLFFMFYFFRLPF